MSPDDPELAILQRRNNVRSLLVKGLKPRQIMQNLNDLGLKVTEKTVDRDIRTVRGQVWGEIEKSRKGLDDVLHEFLMSSDEEYSQALKVYERAEESRDKIQALRLMGEIRERKVKIFQSAGILKPAELGKVDIKVKWLGDEDPGIA